MITSKPDTKLTHQGLEAKIAALRREAGTAPEWFLREKFIDRGRFDPHYILHFKAATGDPGDDTGSERLYHVSSGFSIKNITREPDAGKARTYWQRIDGAGLAARLERFLRMYRENYLQPPGYRGDVFNRDIAHPKFEGKRFVFRLESPATKVVAVGPARYASQGALRGKVFDHESGQTRPQDVIELVTPDGVLTRTMTDGEGYFYFSRAPVGEFQIRVRNRDLALVYLEEPYEKFGAVQARVGPAAELAGNRLEFHAPDGEVFSDVIDKTGKAAPGPLPAFPYIVRIPGFLFRGTVTVEARGVIGGTLFDESGVALKNIPVRLSGSADAAPREQSSDASGNFRFADLSADRYTLTVPGFDLYARKTDAGQIRGSTQDIPGDVEIELVLNRQVVARAEPGAFQFGDLTPGAYELRAPGLQVAAKIGEPDGQSRVDGDSGGDQPQETETP